MVYISIYIFYLILVDNDIMHPNLNVLKDCSENFFVGFIS